MRRGKGLWPTALLTLLALGTWMGSMVAVQRAGEMAAGTEVYWSNGGISPAQVEKAWRWALEDGQAEPPALALWREEQNVTVQTGDGERQAESRALFLYGEGELVWPARFLAGGYPLRGEGGGAAVSSALADALWGNWEVTGQTLIIGNQTCQVWGIFQGDSPLLLVQDSADSGTFYDHGVLPADGGGESTESILNRYGFLGGTPTDLPFFAWCLTVLAALPGLLLGLRLLLRLFRRLLLLWHSPVLLAQYAPPALAAVCVTLWAMGPMESLPGRVIPTRWSDFDFWARLVGELAAEVNAVFSHVPYLRELRFWGLAGMCLLLSLGALAFTALWSERVRPVTLTQWWWGCAFALGCVFCFARAAQIWGGVWVNRGLWLLPGLTLTVEGCLLLHEKSLYAAEEGRERDEETDRAAEREELPTP